MKHGTLVSESFLKETPFNNESSQLPVCLVDNGWMTAAGIAFDEHEMNDFMHPDSRPKQWFLVPKDVLKEFM